MMSYWRYETLHLLTITFYMGLDTKCSKLSQVAPYS